MIGITSTMNGETTDNQKWPVDILLTSREVSYVSKQRDYSKQRSCSCDEKNSSDLVSLSEWTARRRQIR